MTGPTLCWLNLLRGLFNNSSWTHYWAVMMNNTIAMSLENPLSTQTMLNLQQQNFLLTPPLRLPSAHPPHNAFPLQPIPISSIVRPVPPPLPLSHIPIHTKGTSIEIYRTQSLTFLTTAPPQTSQLDVSVESSLKYETGTINYRLLFNPSALIARIWNLSRFARCYYISPSMNILSWNVRGAASAEFRRTFRELINTHQPDAALFTKTRVSGDRANTIISSLGFQRYTKVDAIGFAGGIWVLWNPYTITMEPIASSFQEIHLEAKVSNFSFLLFAIYGSPLFERCKLLWSSLSELSPILNYPWLFLGDFNDIASTSEKFGGGPPNDLKIELFNNFLNTCGLLDLGFVGPPFTWTNGRSGGHIIRSRIDRAHANFNWVSHFPDTTVLHLPKSRFDHCPLLLKTHHSIFNGLKPFRFETMWLNHPDFKNFVTKH